MSEAGATGTEQPEEAKELEAESNVSSQTPSSSKAEAKEKDNEQKKDSSFFSKVTAQYKSMSKDDKEKVLENAGAGIKQLEDPISPEKKLQESRQLTSKEQHQKLFEDMDIDSIRKRSQEDQSKAQKFINRDAEEQELLEQASNLTDSELISHASAGLLLRGLRQDSKGGWTRCKRRLVCVPEDARLVGSQIGDEVEEREFYEASQFDSFMRSLGSMNKSFSSKLQCDVFIVKGKGGVDDTRQDESCHHTETHVKSKFYSKAHIVFVPTAACYLQPNKLSQEATKELKIIEHQLRSLDWEHTENSIRVFMSKFGSHATSGTVHFGGILAFEASYSCVENESLEVGKSLVSKALDSVLRAGVGRLFFEGYLGSGAGSVSYSKLKTDAKNENEFNSEQISRVSIRTKKIGGPIEVSSEPSWRRGLASSNRTWHVVKCDAEIVPVWDLFLKEDLEDAKKLAQSFKLVWVKDNSRADLCPMGIPNELEHALINYNLCLKDFAKHAKKSSDSRLWNEFFKKLLKSIATIERFTAPSESGSEWTKNDDLTIVLREFVNRTDFLLNSPESEQILASVKRLIQISGNVDFPEKQKVAAVIYFQDFQPYKLVLKEQTVVSPKDFVEILRSRYLIDMHKFLQEKGVTAFPHDHEIQVLQTMQPELTSAVNQLLESLTVAEQFYSKFVTACVLAAYGFSHNDKQFRGFLDIQQVKQLADTIELETTDSFFVKAAGKDEFIQAQVLAVYCRHVRKVDKADRKWLLDICESLWLEKIRKIIYEFVQSDHKNWQNLKAEISNVLQQYQKDGQAFYVNLNPLLECTDKRDAQSPNKVESIDFSNSLTAVETFAIQALGLNEFWPGKLSMSTVMKYSTEAVPNDTRIGLGIIKQLAMTNYNFRNSSVVRVQNLVEADKDGCGDVWSDNYQPTTQKNSESVFIPFCDAILFCFLSASTQLKQALTEKLFDCKLAIPLLYSIADQNYLFTWTLRGLVLKFPEQGSLGGSKELIVDTSLFSVVSLIRLGTSSFSKSIIANRCINKKHDVFTVSGKNSLKKKFSDGSIELAWMLPEENDKSGLPGAVCVLNLRGDAMKHSEQRDFLASVSSYVIVVLPDEDCRHSDEYSKALQQLYLSKTRLVILVTTPTIPKFLRKLQQTFKASDEKHKLELLRLKWTDAENSNIVCLDESDIAAMLKEVMFEVQRKAIFSEELTSLACFRAFGQRMKWVVDDAIDQVGGPIESAQCLFENICNLSEDLAAIKRKFLPLQGRLCIEISQRKKQRFRKNRNMVGDEKSHWVGKMDAEIQEMRREQIILLQKQLEDYPQLMPAFLNFTQSSNPVEVFLQQLAIKLNALSIDKMTVFRRELESIWQKILKSEDTTLKSKEHFLEMENVLNDASFGLEHIFREVGQIYEAIMSNAALSAQNQEFTRSLARIAANLLLQGHALEIIDGDTSSVANMWLQAVLNQVEDIVGVKRLLVLSVLGIQSSGKSTLLNTMFGLRFPVSAGRCTRGAFMQLVRNEPEESGLNVDYVAVVDTEGLRAPELGGGMKEHDNELATMVIGLADVVLINIMGEGLSEISDVLQIVVHAFIRMKMAFKSVLLGKGCIFLHQNVAAVDSVERLRSASSRLLLELNKTVETAAGEEGAADLKRFTDIIDFDPDEDVCYWPHLWEGSPPNAPVNPDYSRKAQQAREKILKKLKQFESSKMSFKNLSIRFCDLWDAVLKEDFVFSFQNTLELKAYKEVECKFTGISFNFESCISDWVRSYGAVKMRQCGKIDHLEVQLNGIEQLLRAKIQKEKETAQHELTEFLAGHELSHISKKWEQERLNNLETSSRRIEESSMQMLQSLKEEQRVTLVTTVTMDAYQRDILSRARTLAERMKGEQVGEEQKTKEFEKMWKLFVGQVTTKEEIQWTAPCEAEKAVKEEFRDVQSTTLDEEISRLKAHKDAIFFRFILRGTFQESYVLDEHYCYSKPLTARIGLKKKTSSKCAQRLVAVANIALAKIDALLQKRTERHMERHIVDKSDFQRFVRDIRNEISKYNKSGLNGKKEPSVKATQSFEVSLSIHACSHALAIFEAWNNQYQQQHGIAAKIREFKSVAFSCFSKRLQQETEEVIAADLFAAVIKQEISKKIIKEKCSKVLKSVYGDFDQTKLHLIIQIMESLADREIFEDFIFFIWDSKNFARKWLADYITETMFSPTSNNTIKYNALMKELIAPLTESVKDSVHQASEDLQAELTRNPIANRLFAKWMQKFCASDLKLGLSIEIFAHIDEDSISDPQNFERLLFGRLEIMDSELQAEHSVENKAQLEWVGEAPYDVLLNRLWGCPEQCPFCGEPCSNSSEGHHIGESKWSHMCIQHRPAGVTGTRANQMGNELALTMCNFDIQTGQNFNCGAVSYKCRQSGRCNSGGPDSESLTYVFHEYKDFKSFFPDWKIAPDASNSSSPYWMWFMSRFSKELQRHYDCDPLNFPESWRQISAEQAKASLSVYSLEHA